MKLLFFDGRPASGRTRYRPRASQSISGASSTARCTASATARRSATCFVFSLVGFTRLVRRITNSRDAWHSIDARGFLSLDLWVAESYLDSSLG
jgi:hypothetical protein